MPTLKEFLEDKANPKTIEELRVAFIVSGLFGDQEAEKAVEVIRRKAPTHSMDKWQDALNYFSTYAETVTLDQFKVAVMESQGLIKQAPSATTRAFKPGTIAEALKGDIGIDSVEGLESRLERLGIRNRIDLDKAISVISESVPRNDPTYVEIMNSPLKPVHFFAEYAHATNLEDFMYIVTGSKRKPYSEMDLLKSNIINGLEKWGRELRNLKDHAEYQELSDILGDALEDVKLLGLDKKKFDIVNNPENVQEAVGKVGKLMKSFSKGSTSAMTIMEYLEFHNVETEVQNPRQFAKTAHALGLKTTERVAELVQHLYMSVLVTLPNDTGIDKFQALRNAFPRYAKETTMKEFMEKFNVSADDIEF